MLPHEQQGGDHQRGVKDPAELRAGRDDEVAELTQTLGRAGDSEGWSQPIWSPLGTVMAHGLVCHARGVWEGAASALGATAHLVWQGGGSHAQRDLFHQIHLDALIRAGRHAEAQQILMGRLGFEPDSVPNNLALARVYDALDLPAEAAAARARAGMV